MPRLNKALKELNVGINTVAEFLQKKGKPLEDASINAKITDEQYDILLKEFGSDKQKKQETNLDIQKRKEREQQEKAERKAKELQEQLRREAELKKQKEQQEVFRLESERKTEVKVLGKLKPANPVKESPVEEETSAPEPEIVEIEETTEVQEQEPVELPEQEVSNEEDVVEADEETIIDEVEDEIQEKPQSQKVKSSKNKTVLEETEDGVYHVVTPEAGLNFKKVGFIDLSNINSKTRPDKKSKAERKKEREEKERARQEAKNKYKESVMQEIGDGKDGEDGKKKKRKRINKGKVDINAVASQQKTNPKIEKGASAQGAKNNNQRQNVQNVPQQGKKNKKKKDVKVELTDEEVAKQVKETLARLTTKSVKSSVKNRKEKRERHRLEMEQEEGADSKVLQLTEFVTVNELATMMNVPVTQVIGTCMSIGMMVSINQRLDAETINIVAEEFGFTTSYVSGEVSNAIVEEDDNEEDLEPRAPIITVMGHVDHGKTSLLDYIRKTNVIAGEAGGITQHIGAYNVKMKDGRHITFLDTPGHEAFTAMRARGAQVTDIAIIIIAADDAIMPQTKEAIAHAQAAGVPMVFAINKIDKPGANPEKIKEQLANMNLLVEDWGGKYQSQEISAKKGIGVDELMDKVLLEAELLDLRANPNRKATGSVIESTLDKGRGYVATVLCQNGTLHQGDIILAGIHFGRVRAMFNERGQRIEKALPAEPAVILGLNGAPTAGDTFHVMETEQEARDICNKREQLKREQGIRTMKRVDLNELGRRIALGDFKELNIVVKGDVDGSIEALSDSLIKLSTEKIQVNVIHKAVGQISESDVTLAAASDAIIVGFQVRPSKAARALADQEGVDIRLYSVIYDTIEEIKSAMEGMLAPETKEEVTANLEVRQVYHITKVGTVAGAYVTSGKVQRSNKVRVIRDGIVIYTGQINALKRFKDDVKEVGVNFECGISIVNYDNLHEGDILETFTEVEVKQKL
ncbi:MAG: translation initiation factor IF-2 [Bacteroidaceae bacterium]|nr:translation initiation factor IF-2 [Bacteroidaceae bacterium]